MRALAQKLGLLAATCVLLALGLELGLRLFWDGFYVKTPRAYAQPHPVRGWANRPHAQVIYGEPEFSVQVTHNEWGYRGGPLARARTPGRTRALVLGDSFAYGVGVADDETFSARLAALAPSLEVINTGVNGYGTGQELLLLRDEGLAFAPDLVIVSFFWNDVGNSYRNRFVRFELDESGALRHLPPPPEMLARQQAAAERDEEPARDERRAWLRHSYAYRFASDRAKLLSYFAKLGLGIAIEETDFVQPDERERAWALARALLGEIQRLASGAGARVLLLAIPDQVQVEPDVSVPGLDPGDYEVQERLREFAAQAGIELLDALPALAAERRARGTPIYYLRDRHLLPAGQDALARALHERLQQLGWLEPRQPAPAAPGAGAGLR